jgi:methyl-accepting chemotaxis protein
VLGAVYVGATSLATDSMTDPDADWQTVLIKCLDEAVYIVPGLLVIVPLVAVNLLRLTRRYASPIDKLSKEMQLLSAGKSDAPLVFDNSDAWSHLATQFNELREEILELRQTVLLQPHLSRPSPAISQTRSLPEIEIPNVSKELADAMLPA